MDLSEFDIEVPTVEKPAWVDEAAWILPLRHLSATSLSMYMRCPNQFRHRYILGEKKRPGEALVLGHAVHSTLEWNFKAKVESHEDFSRDDLVTYFQDEAIPASIASQEEDAGQEIAWDAGVDDAKRRGSAMIDHYRSLVSPRIQPIDAEEEFLIEGMAPVPIIGYPDVTTDSVIVDFKTAKQLRRVVKPDWQLQGRLYNIARSKPIDFHILAHTGCLTPLEEEGLSIRPSTAEVEAVTRLVRNVTQRMEADYLTFGPDEDWPTYGAINEMYNKAICAWCGWNDVCPAGGNL